MAIVTRASLSQLITRGDMTSIHAIGRALVHLHNRQTVSELASGSTNTDNGRGFTHSDARSGTIHARYYLKHRNLLPWMVEMWTKPNSKGIPRLAKYHAQLNSIAETKRMKSEPKQTEFEI